MGYPKQLIDISYLKEMSDNCPRFMAEVISVFKEQVPELIAVFKEGAKANDFEKLKAAAHKSKNAMSVMGVYAMVEELKAFEDADLPLMASTEISGFVVNFENTCWQTINELDLVLENINAHI